MKAAHGVEQTPSIRRPAIFIAHPSELLTDYLANGDGQVAYGFIAALAARGYELHVAVDRMALRNSLPANITLYPLNAKINNRALHIAEFAIRMRLLFERLRRTHHFVLCLQMNPVYPGISLALLGCGVPLILGTYVARWDSTNIQDAYTGSSGLTAKLRDVVIAMQQSHAEALLLTTPAANNRVPRMAKESGKISHLPHGIDPEMFFPRTDAQGPLPAGNKSILFLASVSERKGIDELLKAFEMVAAKFPDSHLTIVGAGDRMDRVKEYLLTSACKDKVTLHGRVTRPETPAIYQQHTVYCLPSYGEPYATTILEAMASGLPVVSTLDGGTPYMVPPGGGRLVAARDVNALAEALIEILQSPDLQKSMGEENRRVILETFAWNRVIDKLEQIYYRVSGGAIGVAAPGS